MLEPGSSGGHNRSRLTQCIGLQQVDSSAGVGARSELWPHSRMEPGSGAAGSEALSPTGSRRDGRAPRARRGAARRGRRARLGLQPRRLCLRGAEGLRPPPCSFRGDAPRSSSRTFLPLLRFSVPSPAQGKNSQCQRKRNSLQGLKFQTKSCPYPQLGGPNQPLV